MALHFTHITSASTSNERPSFLSAKSRQRTECAGTASSADAHVSAHGLQNRDAGSSKAQGYQNEFYHHNCQCHAKPETPSIQQDVEMANGEIDIRCVSRDSGPRIRLREDIKHSFQEQQQEDWDEEATLIALLDEDQEAAHNDKSAIVDRLQPAFDNHYINSKDFLKDTLIPVIQRVRDVHDHIDLEVNPAYAEGLRIFNTSCQKMEDASRLEHATVQATYMKTKIEIQDLFDQLKKTDDDGKQLLKQLGGAVGERVKRLRACADSFPKELEQLVSKLDKKTKSLGGKDEFKSKEKLLRSILDKY